MRENIIKKEKDAKSSAKAKTATLGALAGKTVEQLHDSDMFDLVASIRARSDRFDLNPQGPSPTDIFKNRRRSETVRPMNRDFEEGMEIGSYQLNT